MERIFKYVENETCTFQGKRFLENEACSLYELDGIHCIPADRTT